VPDRVHRVERESGPLKRGLANNLGARRAVGELLIFLSDAIEVLEPEWIDHLALFAGIPGAGPVGPLLARPDGMVEQAGFVVGLEDPVSPALAGIPADGDGYYGNLSCAREVSALSVECMLVNRRLFADLGGFREDYRTQFEDFDLCRRSLEKGLTPVYTPLPAVVCHETPAARRVSFDVVDRALFVDCWYEDLRAGDPFYNPNLSTERACYEPATAERLR
jgi:GT2 family glycosyltransferase